MFRTPTKSDSNTKSLYQLQHIALSGCESAQRIFQAHAKRPYFKKIDLLCDRLKQDLTVTDKAVININSHGLAWAIKDFIFVFNRIINAWIIMRDYFYSTSEGMSCVNESMDPNFQQDFLNWQEATISLTKSLISNFENLHLRDQRNGNRKTNAKDSDSLNTARSSASKTKSSDTFQNIFDPLIARNSEQAQLNGGYLKSAVYKPVSSSEESTPPDTPGSSSADFDAFKVIFNDLLPNSQLERSGNLKPLYKRCSAESSPAQQSGIKTQPRNLSAKFSNLGMTDFDDLDGISPFTDV